MSVVVEIRDPKCEQTSRPDERQDLWKAAAEFNRGYRLERYRKHPWLKTSLPDNCRMPSLCKPIGMCICELQDELVLKINESKVQKKVYFSERAAS